MTMTQEQARGGHCLQGGSIIAGTARCECGLWWAGDYLREVRRAARRAHLDEVLQVRLASPT